MSEISPKKRHKARSYALQALYQWHFAGGDIDQIQTQFITINAHVKVDWVFFRELFTGVLQNLPLLDEVITANTDHPFEKTLPVELALLRLGTFELMQRIDVPYRVVLNEYIELAKLFGANEGHAFINAILDKLAHSYRTAELNMNISENQNE